MRTIFSHYVLPIAALAILVGGLAWLTQYLPSWRGAEEVKSPPKPSEDARPAIRVVSLFPGLEGVAIWEPQHGLDKDAQGKEQPRAYVKEFERGVKGYYDFPFENLLDEPVDVGLAAVSCDCSSAQVCVLPDDEWQKLSQAVLKAPGEDVAFTKEPTWHKITLSAKETAPVPARGRGLIRVSWVGKKETGAQLNINIAVSADPRSDTARFPPHRLMVPVMMVRPIIFDADRQKVGILDAGGDGRAVFHVWSATRSPEATRPEQMLDVQFGPESPDPLFQVKTERLTPAEEKALTARLLKDKIVTRIKTAYRVTVTVHERADGKQLDLGPFRRELPFRLDGVWDKGPLVIGLVMGEVQVGGADGDQWRIQLGDFDRKAKVRKLVTLWADPKAELEVVPEGHHPAALEVHNLARDTKGSTKTRAKWTLEIVIPPEACNGPLAEDSAIALRVRNPGAPPRLARIAVAGTATR